MADLDKIFDSFVGSSLFKNKVVLQSNYSPESILHREKQVEAVASVLGPVLSGEKSSNLFLYGKTGTGKTLCARYVGEKIESRVKEMGNDNLRFLYINCKSKKISDTEYRIIAELINLLGGKVYCVPSSVIYHLGGFTSGRYKINKKVEFLVHRNSLMTLLKNYSNSSLLRLFLPRILFEMISGVAFKEKRLAVFNSLLWISKNIRDILKKRTQVQAIRKIKDKDLENLIYKKSVVIEHFLKRKNKFIQLENFKASLYAQKE